MAKSDKQRFFNLYTYFAQDYEVYNERHQFEKADDKAWLAVSYARELGFEPLEHLALAAKRAEERWAA
ncbi:MAG: hypothetical protein ACPF8W_05105 [Luminiphilus sp.]